MKSDMRWFTMVCNVCVFKIFFNILLSLFDNISLLFLATEFFPRESTITSLTLLRIKLMTKRYRIKIYIFLFYIAMPCGNVCVYVNVYQFYDSTNFDLMYSRQLIILLYEIPQTYLFRVWTERNFTERCGVVKNYR